MSHNKRPDVSPSAALMRPISPRGSSRQALDRILDNPQLARVVPQLRPEMLHRVIDHYGLEDCADLVALATPEQLTHLFDLDLWRGAQAGLDEQFDAERFAVWLAVLLDAGTEAFATKLAAMDADLLASGFAEHVRVFDVASAAGYVMLDGQSVAGPLEHEDTLAEVGGYHLVARRPDAEDTVLAAVRALELADTALFHRIMSRCRALSSSAPEVDGLDALLGRREQADFDAGFDREGRRRERGYATPSESRAFLEMSRRLRPGIDAMPAANVIASAYFRAADSAAMQEEGQARAVADWDEPGPAVALLVGGLADAGVVFSAPRALLDGPRPGTPRLERMGALMNAALERAPQAYHRRIAELGFVANTIKAGCGLQARAFTAQEAWDAAVATCNLGLERWPAQWRPEATGPEDLPLHLDLVVVFQGGWTTLHNAVVMQAADRLVTALADLRYGDRLTQAAVDRLRRVMTKHLHAGNPWLARNEMDVIASVDLPAWAALTGLIAECPVLQAELAGAPNERNLTISPAAFEFISEEAQLERVGDFLRVLPERLRLEA